MRDVMKALLIALGLTAAAATLATPAHAVYSRDCLRGAPCPGFYAQSPRYYGPPRRYYGPSPSYGPPRYYGPSPYYGPPSDTTVHQATTKTNSASVIQRSSGALLEQSLPKPLPESNASLSTGD